MKNWQERLFSRPKAARQGAAHDCMDAGGRATQGAVAEGGACRMKNWQESQFSRPEAARQGAAQGGAA
jgi:hypothetical protein